MGRGRFACQPPSTLQTVAYARRTSASSNSTAAASADGEAVGAALTISVQTLFAREKPDVHVAQVVAAVGHVAQLLTVHVVAAAQSAFASLPAADVSVHGHVVAAVAVAGQKLPAPHCVASPVPAAP